MLTFPLLTEAHSVEILDLEMILGLSVAETSDVHVFVDWSNTSASVDVILPQPTKGNATLCLEQHNDLNGNRKITCFSSTRHMITNFMTEIKGILHRKMLHAAKINYVIMNTLMM